MATVPETPMDTQVTDQPVEAQVQYLVPVPPPAPIEKRSVTMVEGERAQLQSSTDTSTRTEVEHDQEEDQEREQLEPDGGTDLTPQKTKPKRADSKSPGVMMIAASSKSKNV